MKSLERLSGSERFNAALTHAMATFPTILLLDEPTNHLDSRNRKSLIRMLIHFKGTLIIASHDEQLLRACSTTLWHIDNGSIHIYNGGYDTYLKETTIQKDTLIKNKETLLKEKKKAKKALEKEHIRAHKSAHANKYENDRKLKGALQEKGSRTYAKNKKNIAGHLDTLNQNIQQCFIPETIIPDFSLNTTAINRHKAIMSIVNGSCGYHVPVLSQLNLTVCGTERIALTGDNASGKSTLIKAIKGDIQVNREGSWFTPSRSTIGYLDQHYSTLDLSKTVFEMMSITCPLWNDKAIRKHLNDFLFKKNQDIEKSIAILSGGEKARLCLALIAAMSPPLLLLDEVTNNIDAETRNHITDVLHHYPGALIVISHDESFLNSLTITTVYEVKDGTVSLKESHYTNTNTEIV